MDKKFRAYRIHLRDGNVRGELETLTRDELEPGNILVRVEYSGINYKDALAATGTSRILREYPLIGGIDLAGEVLDSADERFRPGDKVLAIGCGQSETRDGGYTELAHVNGECALHIPDAMDTRTVMALGTAGFTAALAVHRMEHNGQRPELGPIVVTGATGGVGSVAIDLLSARGYQVTALTGKGEQRRYLESLGATDIIDRKTLDLGTKPLEHADWGGAIDNLGGEILAWLTRTVKPGGNIASVGLAAGIELQTTVMPFILRGVSLLGINMDVGHELSTELWRRLGSDLKPRHLERIVTREVSLSELPDCFDAYISGSALGRTLVRVQES
ncbi:MAG: acryloyl-CoA reductase [Gammaproteobacteria bacterium]